MLQVNIITKIYCPKWTTNTHSEVSFVLILTAFLSVVICFFVSVLVHMHHTLWWGRLWWGHRLRSESKGGRERGKTRRDNERQKVKWKTSLPLPLGLISFGPQWSSPFKPPSQTICWHLRLKPCHVTPNLLSARTRQEMRKSREGEWARKNVRLFLVAACSPPFMGAVAYFICKKGVYFCLSLKGAEATKWPV